MRLGATVVVDYLALCSDSSSSSEGHYTCLSAFDGAGNALRIVQKHHQTSMRYHRAHLDVHGGSPWTTDTDEAFGFAHARGGDRRLGGLAFGPATWQDRVQEVALTARPRRCDVLVLYAATPVRDDVVASLAVLLHDLLPLVDMPRTRGEDDDDEGAVMLPEDDDDAPAEDALVVVVTDHGPSVVVEVGPRGFRVVGLHAATPGLHMSDTDGDAPLAVVPFTPGAGWSGRVYIHDERLAGLRAAFQKTRSMLMLTRALSSADVEGGLSTARLGLTDGILRRRAPVRPSAHAVRRVHSDPGSTSERAAPNPHAQRATAASTPGVASSSARVALLPAQEATSSAQGETEDETSYIPDGTPCS